MTATSQMDSWKAAVLCHELNYDFTYYPHKKNLVFSIVKNTFALSSEFQRRCYIPNPLGSTTVHGIHTSVDYFFPCYTCT